MTHRVVLLSRVRAQISDTLAWLADQSIEGANRWLDELDAALLKLEDDPERHPLAAESASVRYHIREVSFQTPQGRRYRLLFAVVVNEVRVLSLRRPGEDFATPAELR